MTEDTAQAHLGSIVEDEKSMAIVWRCFDILLNLHRTSEACNVFGVPGLMCLTNC